MDWLKTGLSETVALIRRVGWRAWRCGLRWKLAGAETTLGELGWLQADFPPEIEERIDQIRGVESEQAQIFNESAEHASAIEAVRKSICEFREKSEAGIRELEDERAPVAEVEREEAAKLKASRDKLDESERRLAEIANILEILKARLSAASGDLRRAGPDDPILLRDQSASLHRERERLRHWLDKVAADFREARVRHEEVHARLSALDTRLDGLRRELGGREKEAAAEIRRLEKARRAAAGQVTSLDRLKKAHYRLVGRCLADARIPPRNQPGALQAVMDIRAQVAGITEKIAESREVSARANRWQILGFLAALVIGGLLLAILAFWMA